jgi:hypothetical protein
VGKSAHLHQSQSRSTGTSEASEQKSRDDQPSLMPWLGMGTDQTTENLREGDTAYARRDAVLVQVLVNDLRALGNTV